MNYNNNKNDDAQYYQSIVFNMSDIMCSIFQYLDVMECVLSYVNSHWLYYSWNPNSFYYTRYFSRLVESTIDVDQKRNWDKDENFKIKYVSLVQQWQRMIKIKKICVWIPTNCKNNKLILNKFSTLKNVEFIDIDCSEQDYPIVKRLLNNCRDKILYCDVSIDKDAVFGASDKVNTLPPIILNNVKSVYISDFFVPIVWSNKCEILTLDIQNIKFNKEWCNMVIQCCDCSGIKKLNVNIDEFVHVKDENQDWSSVLNKLAAKFTSLENMKIIARECGKIHHHALSFWGFVNDNCKHNLKIDLVGLTENDDFAMIGNLIESDNCDITGIDISFGSDDHDGLPTNFDSVIKPIFEKASLERISITCLKSSNRLLKLFDFEVGDNNYNCGKFSSLKIVEIVQSENDTKLSDINDFLTCDLVLKGNHDLFINLNFGCTSNDTSSFKLLCRNVFNLIVKQVAIHIYIEFNGWDPKSQFSEYKNIFVTMFAKVEMTKEYKKPKCNKYCVPENNLDRKFDIIYDEQDISSSQTRFFVCNADEKYEV